MQALDLAQLQMRMFPVESPMNVGGALTCNKEFYKPSATDGPLLYLNGNPDVQIYWIKWKLPAANNCSKNRDIARIWAHGVFIDTEGNRIALHSIPKQMS